MYPNLMYAAIGIHPNSKFDFSTDNIHRLRSMVKENKVVAIGEIGLDYYRLINPINYQKNIFIFQLDLANEFDLPVIIHCREATDDILNIIEKWSAENKGHTLNRSIKGVFHSFSGDLIVARRIIEMGFMLGISGLITYPKNIGLAETIREIGINNLIVETDAPYLTPQPIRGKRNLPENVLYVIATLSNIFNLPDETIRQKTSENASRIFHWDD